MEKYQPKIETEIFLPDQWYMDDVFLTDVYQKIKDEQLSEASIKHMYYEVQDELEALLQRSDELNLVEQNKASTLNNVARELFQHITPDSLPSRLPDQNDVIDMGDSIH